jgi:glycerol-3-phosphate dehydrogenase
MKRDLASLEGQTFDLVVIGGGIVGAAVARDAARRGLAVALAERDDFACAASEGMSHMVHGGIRYLASGGLRNVRASLRERAIWRQIAPHKIDVIDCMTPVVGAGVVKSLAMQAAVTAFNLLGGRNVATAANRTTSYVSAREAVAAEPSVAQPGLEGALTYLDCRVDEPERVVVALLQDAVAGGAVVANHLECVSLQMSGGRVEGAVMQDRLSGSRLEIRSRSIVNATGPWAEAVAARLLGRPGMAKVTLSRGVHFVAGPVAVSHALTLAGKHEHAVVMPWRGMSLVGTTDDLHDGDPAQVAASDEDIARLRAKVERLLPGARLGRSIGRFAAVRALPGSGEATYRMARETAIVDHAEEGATGLLSVYGGKWTTARLMAEQSLDRAIAHLGLVTRPCDTATAPLIETPGDQPALAARLRKQIAAWPAGSAEMLVAAYGTRAEEVALRLGTEPATPEAIERARFAQAAEAEMAVTPADFERRLARWHALTRPGVAKRAAEWLTARNAPQARREGWRRP